MRRQLSRGVRVRRLVLTALVLLLPWAIGLSSAQGALLTLSTHASNSVDPAVLDATLDFSVVSSTLTFTVINLTPETVDDPALKINEIYFNAKSNVTDLTLTNVEGSQLQAWDSAFLQGGGDDGDGNPHQVDGFGKFDVYLIDGQDNQPHVIDSGETVSFIFQISGTGPFYDTDFIDLSTQVDQHIQSYGAGKFYNGDGISAYGATNIPEPANIMLLGFGALVLLRKRKP